MCIRIFISPINVLFRGDYLLSCDAGPGRVGAGLVALTGSPGSISLVPGFSRISPPQRYRNTTKLQTQILFVRFYSDRSLCDSLLPWLMQGHLDDV